MISIFSTEAFRSACPAFVGAAIEAEVVNSPTGEALKREMSEQADRLCAAFTFDTIKLRPGIAATRQAYRAAGKDPSRYRPACEQLARRVLQGKGLYHVSTLVDLVNLASLYGGYSTAALDADRLVLSEIILDLGRADEPYEGIGRGVLNIEHLPVYRDAHSAFATPTSDSVRTATSMETRRLIVLINGYDGRRNDVEATARYTQELLRRYAESDGGSITYYE